MWNSVYSTYIIAVPLLLRAVFQKLRKRVVLRLDQKLEIIKCLRKGEAGSSVAQICDVGRTAVNDFKRDAEKIELHVSNMQTTTHGDIRSCKTIKPVKY